MSAILDRLQSLDPEVRQQALAESNGTVDAQVAEFLVTRLADEKFSEPERQLIAEVVSRCSLPEIEAKLLSLLASSNAYLRTMAAMALGGQRSGEAVRALILGLSDCVNTVRNWAERSLLGMIPTVRQFGIEPLIALLKHPTPLSRSPAARLLGHTHDDRALAPLMSMARDDADWLSRMSAIRALGDLGISDALDVVEGALNSDPKNRVRAAAAEAIGKLRPPQAEQILRGVLAADEDDGVQKSAGEALRSLGFEVSEINDDGWE